LNIRAIYDELQTKIHEDRLILDAPMKDYTSFKAGGNAALLVSPGDGEELAFALKLLAESGTRHIVMGNGSNLLVRDEGFPGVILRLGEDFQEITVFGSLISAGAGTLLSNLSRIAMMESLTGLEFASGIPGSVGGAVFMNAGAYDGEISRVLESADVLASDGGRVYNITRDELLLSYRHSRLQNTGEVLLKAYFRLVKGSQPAIKANMQELAAKRAEKQPLNYPSAGSFFKRPEGHFAGKLIQDAGLKGLSVGGAQVSPLHCGFIVNTGGATAKDIIDLMEIVKATVFEQSGVLLEPEVRIIG